MFIFSRTTREALRSTSTDAYAVSTENNSSTVALESFATIGPLALQTLNKASKVHLMLT